MAEERMFTVCARLLSECINKWRGRGCLSHSNMNQGCVQHALYISSRPPQLTFIFFIFCLLCKYTGSIHSSYIVSYLLLYVTELGKSSTCRCYDGKRSRPAKQPRSSRNWGHRAWSRQKLGSSSNKHNTNDHSGENDLLVFESACGAPDLASAIIRHQETLCVLDLKLALALENELDAWLWDFHFVQAMKSCKKLVDLSLPLDSGKSTCYYLSLIKSLPDLVNLTIYNHFASYHDWIGDPVRKLFAAAEQLKSISIKARYTDFGMRDIEFILKRR